MHHRITGTSDPALDAPIRSAHSPRAANGPGDVLKISPARPATAVPLEPDHRYQLPYDIGDFVGRASELDRLVTSSRSDATRIPLSTPFSSNMGQ